MKKILITGALGQLGSELRLLANEFTDYQYSFSDIDHLDLSRFDLIEKYLREEKFHAVINCAAYTAVDKAEEETNLASLINAKVPEFLAKKSVELGFSLVHISTDYVFDGKGHLPYKETDATNPLGIYAKTKLDGETAILLHARSACIVRTSWLYSSFGKNFVKTMIKYGTERKYLRVVYDQIGSPTYARDLAKAILTLLPEFTKLQNPEIYHYANEGVASWYDFAKAIIELNGIDCKIDPIESFEFPTPTARPPFSVLNKSKIKSLGITIPYWKDSLSACLTEMKD